MTYLGFEIREGTFDQYVVDSVYRDNEYQLPSDLSDVDLVIDVGAHIGSFSRLAADSGARNVVAFEAEPQNAALAKRNLQAQIESGQVELFHAAMWRSDSKDEVYIPTGYIEEPEGINTGGTSVNTQSIGTPVPSANLDEVLEQFPIDQFPKIILKLDCEGAEWPILYTFSQFERIYAICGEYHQDATASLSSPPAGLDGSSSGYTFDRLKAFLQRQGFICHFNPPKQDLGLFWAIRPTPKTQSV